jgi:Fuc2NAc and GlcNAc transferase
VFTQAQLILLTGFLTGTALTYVIMRMVQRAGVLDVPNERSSHTAPIPRGGGLAIVIAFVVFLLVNSRFGFASIEGAVCGALVIGGLIIAVIGVLDDLNHIPAKWRFLAHFVAVIIALSLLPSFPPISSAGLTLKSDIAVFALLAVSLIWFVNLYNFMDGTDGIAGIEAITALAGGALILTIRGEADWPLILGFLAACVSGFLVWNWSPAKVFMGDGCSGFLGFTLGLLAIATSTSEAINVWSWLILFGVFIVDATTTLITRLVRREKWYEAHRSHAYQILSRRFGSHQNVSIGVLIVNIIWLLPLAFVAAAYPDWSQPICCIALLPLLILAIRVGAGRREARI